MLFNQTNLNKIIILTLFITRTLDFMSSTVKPSEMGGNSSLVHSLSGCSINPFQQRPLSWKKYYFSCLNECHNLNIQLYLEKRMPSLIRPKQYSGSVLQSCYFIYLNNVPLKQINDTAKLYLCMVVAQFHTWADDRTAKPFIQNL